MATESRLSEQGQDNPLVRGDREPSILTVFRGKGSWWWLASALAAGLVFGLGALWMLQLLGRPLALFILAIALASAVAPVVDWMCKFHVPRWLSILIVYLLFLILLGALLAYTIPIFVNQTTQLINNSDQWLPRITGWLSGFGINTSNLIDTLTSQFGRFSNFLFTVPVDLVTATAEFILVIVTSLYWVLFLPGLNRFSLSFFPQENRDRVQEVISSMGRAMGGYVRGSLIDGVILGALSYLGYALIGLPYALFLAVLAGVMELLPAIGAFLAVGMAILIGLTVSPTTALITLGVGVLIQQFENHVLLPWVMRSQANISPLLSIFAVVAGGTIGGLFGALVAVPLAAALQALVKALIAPSLRDANQVENPGMEDKPATEE